MNLIELAARAKVIELQQRARELEILAEAAKNRTTEKGNDGRDGAPGINGAKGDRGEPGPRGILGPVGPEGIPGVDGQHGQDGAPGVRGVDGAQGPVGPRGPKGEAGPQGEAGEGFEWRGAWETGRRYVERDVVQFMGSTYVANGETLEKPPAGAWHLMAAKGLDGVDGASSSADAFEEIQEAIDAVESDLLDLAGDVTTLEAASHAAVTIGTANGLSLVGQALSMAAAGSAATGAVTSGGQSFGGAKTFDVSISTPIVNTDLVQPVTAAADATTLTITGNATDVADPGVGVVIKNSNSLATNFNSKIFAVRNSADTDLFYVLGVSGRLHVATTLACNTFAATNNATPVTRMAFSSDTNVHTSEMSNGANAVGHSFATAASWSNATAKLLSFRNLNLEKSFIGVQGAFNGAIEARGIGIIPLTVPTVTTTGATTGGSLAAGTYWYRVSAVNAQGETIASAEVSRVTGGATATNLCNANWTAIPHAVSYNVYGRTSGAQLLLANVAAPLVTFQDTGALTPSGALPTLDSSHQLKSTVADAATARAHILDTATNLTTSGALLLSIRNAGTQLVSIDRTGAYSGGSIACTFIDFANPAIGIRFGSSGAGGTITTASNAFTFLGRVADGAAVIAHTLNNSVNLANATAKILSVQNNSVEKFAIDRAGKFVFPASGAADVQGTTTLVGGTKTVTTTSVKTGDKIICSRNTTGGTAGHLNAPVASIIDGTSFVINSSSGTDTSTVNWWIFK